MHHVVFILFSPNEQRGGGEGALPDFFPVQQTTSGIGHRVNSFMRLATNTLNTRNSKNKKINL